MLHDLFMAIGLVLVLEGLVYAFFPRQLRGMAATIRELTDEQLRIFGLAALGAGVFVIWLVRVFLQNPV